MRCQFRELIQWGSEKYDFVIIDAPPIIVVTDAAIMAPHAGVTLMIARAGTNRIDELEESVKRMHQSGAQVSGFVLNGVEAHRGYGYRYGY